jgi:hypothetical protein
MYAVEVADRQRTRCARCGIGKSAKYLHADGLEFWCKAYDYKCFPPIFLVARACIKV